MSVEFTDSTNDRENGIEVSLDDDIQKQKTFLFKQMGQRGSMRIQTKTFNLGIPSLESIRDVALHMHGKDNWRTRTLHFLHKKWVQTTLMSLLILDVLIIFTELILLTSFPPCTTIKRDCVPCCIEEENRYGFNRLLAGDSSHGVCPTGYEDQTGLPGCDDHKYHRIHLTEDILFVITVVILG